MAKFEVLDVVGPNWEALPAVRTSALLSALRREGWRKDAVRRFGFRQFESYGPNVLAGWFAIETKLEYLTYDESGNEAREGQLPEFERVLSILLVDEGRWVVHERRFFRTDLTKSLVRDRFRDALAWAHAEAGLGGNVRVEPFQQTLTERQMVERLQGEPSRVIRLDVHRLHGQRVPEDFLFYNPRVDLNAEARLFFNHEFDVIEDAEFESAPSQDLRQSKVATALSQTGSVESYSIEDAHGRRYRIRRVIRSTFDLGVELDDPDLDLQRLVSEIVEYVRDEYPSRHSDDPFRGGLLESVRSEDEDDG